MKKSFILFGLGVLALGSCNNDDNDDTASIVGKWSPYKTDVISGKTGKAIPGEAEALDDCDQKGSLEFKSDGKLVSISYDDFTGKCEVEDTSNGTYVYDSNTKKLTIYWGTVGYDGKVRDISSSGLALEAIGDDVDDDGVGDIFVNYYKK